MQWIARPLDYLESSTQTYGEIFTARWSGLQPFVMVSQPQAIQEIFAADSRSLSAGRANGILEPLLGRSSMILLEGDRHQRQRRLLTPPFHGDRMRTYGELICQIAMQVMQQQVTAPAFSVRAAMQEISLRVILETVFGVSQGERCDRLKLLLTDMLDSVSSPLRALPLYLQWLQRDWGDWSPWGQFLRSRAETDRLLFAEIQERRSQPDPARQDVLSLLLAARDEAGDPLTDEELRDELITLLVAGHETTASALTWALYWIHALPEVSSQLAHELATAGDADPMTVTKLPYLNAVCQETLRLYPIAMLAFPRVAQVPFALMGYEFAPGTMLVPCIYLVHHRPDLYPNSKQFRPERFLERSFSPFEYLPFGGGTRRCIGLAFANFELRLVLATLLTQFQFARVDDRPVRPQRRGLTLAPPAHFRLKVTDAQLTPPLATVI